MKKRVPSVVGALVLLLGLFVMPASAAHVIPGPPTTTLNEQPIGVHGNPDCADLLGASDFLFEHKTGVPTDETIPLSFNGLTGSVTVDVKPGSLFDFSFTGDFAAAAVIVKGGPNANFYDYRPDGAAADTDLHAPVNPANNQFYGLSHISFCIIEARAELQITKTAVDDTITIGDKAAFDITVTSLGPATAQNVTIDDVLPDTGLDWEIVSETTAGACSIAVDGNTLHCDVGDLAVGASFTVRVRTTTAMTAAECDRTLDNTAFADADNSDQVSDDAQIRVQCGGIKVVKTAKHADTSGTTSANLAAEFTITDSLGNTHIVTTDATTGVACVDDLPLGAATVDETNGPDGYQEDPDVENVTVTDADCPDPGAGATASFENVPLTDITWSVDSQHNGATSTVVDCKDANGVSLPGYPMTVSDGTDTLPDLPPGTVTCDFVIDP
ncbi:MAG TPA: SpaA isopeptide-forming pilin-related protein [Actinomycetota bacterium]|nr:SpaA isopeptide-forming pilin-related protein [Actinomycetota bacterium]